MLGDKWGHPTPARLDGSDPYQAQWNPFEEFGRLITGSPTTQQMELQSRHIRDPNRGDFQIGGLNDYQNRARQIGDSGRQFGDQTFMDTIDARSRNAYADADYQNRVGQEHAAFQGDGTDANGAAKQAQAFEAIANMAAGKGPSLAAATQRAGLNQMNSAIQSQAMSHAGNTGIGNTQRNLLNAQAANANNIQQTGAMSSAAEQMGALNQMGGQAAAIRSAELQRRNQNLASILGGQGFQLQSRGLANQTNLGLMGLGMNAGFQGREMQAGANNNVFASNVAQTQSNQAYDEALRRAGAMRTELGVMGQRSGAKAAAGAFGTIGDWIKGVASMGAGGA